MEEETIAVEPVVEAPVEEVAPVEASEVAPISSEVVVVDGVESAQVTHSDGSVVTSAL